MGFAIGYDSDTEKFRVISGVAKKPRHKYKWTIQVHYYFDKVHRQLTVMPKQPCMLSDLAELIVQELRNDKQELGNNLDITRITWIASAR